ncbi:MAG TPA: spermidine/putrescine ABC transporter substrate-binding protein [Verrucomicrobiales bacterium]|nr:spermidine/putrescine ABC transporter substrate-binding protein [Verrucomicrobiales bacterium]
MITIARRTLFLAVLPLLAGCGSKKPVLHVYNWDDYIKPGLVARFEQQHGCRVVIDTYESNESMLARLQSGATGYDIIVPTTYMVEIMHKADMLQELDHSKLPHLSEIDLEFTSGISAFDTEMRWSVPYMAAATGIGYIKGRVSNPEASWSMFERPDLKGRTTLLNDMREVIGAALKHLGYSLNTTDVNQLGEAGNVVLKWRSQIAKFEGDQYNAGLASEEFLLCHGYAGDVLQAQEENDKVDFLIPKEGAAIGLDSLVIPKNAPQPALAHAFIDFLCQPSHAAENMEEIYYLAPNTGAYALVDEELRANPSIFLDPETRAKCEVIHDLGEDNAKYIQVWDHIKAGR